MLTNKEGKKLRFIKMERIKGTSKTGNPFDFAQVTISDGLESLEWPLKTNMTEHPDLQALNRGDEVVVTVDVEKQFGRTQFVVTNVELQKTKVAN